MDEDRKFQLDDEQQAEYAREARLQYDPDTVAESQRRWNDYTQAQRDFIMQEGEIIYAEFGDALRRGLKTDDEVVQALLTRWHDHIRHFYEPSLDTLAGLGQLYVDDERFRVKFEAIEDGLAEFLRAAITQYADDLETEAIEALLAEDTPQHNRLSR